MEILQFWAEQIHLHAILWVAVWCNTIAVPVGLALLHLWKIEGELKQPGWARYVWQMVWPGLVALAVWPVFVLWTHFVVSPITTGYMMNYGSPKAYWAVWGYPGVYLGIFILALLANVSRRKHWVGIAANLVGGAITIFAFVATYKVIGVSLPLLLIVILYISLTILASAVLGFLRLRS